MLVDTSIWIGYLNGLINPKTEFLHQAILNDEQIYITTTIIQEVLQGIEKDSQYKKTKGYLLDFDILMLDQINAATGAAELYRSFRKQGITIRKANDCLIAYHAIHYDVAVLHHDKDFTLMARYSQLQEVII